MSSQFAHSRSAGLVVYTNTSAALTPRRSGHLALIQGNDAVSAPSLSAARLQKRTLQNRSASPTQPAAGHRLDVDFWDQRHR